MSTIPEYTPERAYMFARERDSVRAKIAKVIDLHSVPDNDALRNRFDNRLETSLRDVSWIDRCRDCAGFSNMEWDSRKQAQLDDIAKTMIYRILDGDQMLQAVNERHNHKQTDGSGYFKGETLVELYLNHVTREGISQIKSLGFSDRSAVSIGGQVIKKALPFAGEQSFSVKPYYNGELSTEGNVGKIYNHWKLLRDILNNDREMNAMSLFEDTHQRQA